MSNTSPFSRRDFLAVAGTAAGAAALGAMPSRVFAHVSGSDTLKVGLIGCGGRGTGAAIQAIHADKGAVLWAMADAFKERMESCLKAINADIAERKSGREAQVQVTPERMFDGFEGFKKAIAECDVVLLTAPPHFRPMHLREAVNAGKQIFCEKPVAVDSMGLRSVYESVAMAKNKNLSLVCGFCWRYSSMDRDAYKRIHEGAIGKIQAVYTTYNSGGWVESKPRKPEWSDLEFQMRNWQYFTWLSGDHIVEQAVHAINKIAWAKQDVMPVKCIASGGRQVRPNVPETGNVYDHFGVTYEYADGSRAFHMCRHFPNSATDNSDYIIGEKGIARVNGWIDLQEITSDGKKWQSEAPKNDMYQQEHDELFASIRAGKPMNDGQMMTDSTAMAIMARMAAYTGAAVTWDNVMKSREDFALPRYAWDASVPPATVAMPGTTKLLVDQKG